MGSISKIAPLFFDSKDEEIFAGRLRQQLPDVVFLDDNRWRTVPAICDVITNCKSRFVYIWNRAYPKVLPTIRLKSDEFQGPSSGVVIQWMRSKLETSDLLSGQMSVAFDSNDAAMKEFVGKVWRILKEMNVTNLRTLSGDGGDVVSDYIVGEGARRYAESGGVLKHATAPVSYTLA